LPLGSTNVLRLPFGSEDRRRDIVERSRGGDRQQFLVVRGVKKRTGWCAAVRTLAWSEVTVALLGGTACEGEKKGVRMYGTTVS